MISMCRLSHTDTHAHTYICYANPRSIISIIRFSIMLYLYILPTIISYMLLNMTITYTTLPYQVRSNRHAYMCTVNMNKLHGIEHLYRL